MITESQIKAAVRRVGAGETKRLELRDSGERGAGRLILLLRKLGERVATEWYAVYRRAGKRSLAKIGTYPTMPLVDARKKFREEYAPAISAGDEPESVVARRRAANKAGTVNELFEAYVENLKGSGKRSWKPVQRILLSETCGAAKVLGADQAASSVEPADIVALLAKIHDRGATVMAATTRAFLGAAFGFGLKAENDYTRKNAGTSWGLKTNPVAAIPTDPAASRVGQRFLSPGEVRTFWLWLDGERERSSIAPVLMLQLAVGQRTEEVLRISEAGYEKTRAMLYWPVTKNGLPHSLPIAPRAVEILERLPVNRHGLYFPHRLKPGIPAANHSPMRVVQRFLKANPTFVPFTPRDLRRTWKTLAGDAGLTKEMRDLLQNHAKKSDVSSRHYDRYDYLAEKRAAVAKWAAYLDLVLAGEITEVGQRASNVVTISRSEVAA